MLGLARTLRPQPPPALHGLDPEPREGTQSGPRAPTGCRGPAAAEIDRSWRGATSARLSRERVSPPIWPFSPAQRLPLPELGSFPGLLHSSPMWLGSVEYSLGSGCSGTSASLGRGRREGSRRCWKPGAALARTAALSRAGSVAAEKLGGGQLGPERKGAGRPCGRTLPGPLPPRQPESRPQRLHRDPGRLHGDWSGRGSRASPPPLCSPPQGAAGDRPAEFLGS